MKYKRVKAFEYYLPKALNKATTSLRVSWNRDRFIDLRSKSAGLPWSNVPEKRILSAVPNPWVWSLPQTLHFSHPTQSIIRVILRKWWRNSSFNFRACLLPPVNMDDSLKWGLKDLWSPQKVIKNELLTYFFFTWQNYYLIWFSRSWTAAWTSASSVSFPV